jgi:glucose-6-phosphate isomerase
MKLSFDNTLISSETFEEYKTKLEPYLSSLREIVRVGGFEAVEGSLNLPGDYEARRESQALAEAKAANVRIVIVVGIGGSNLGTQAVYEALKDMRKTKEHVKMCFLENVEEQSLKLIRESLEGMSAPEDVLISVISKSGSTTETVANADILFELMSNRFGRDVALERFVVITDRDSTLWRVATENNVATLEMPHTVGGRYSVLSSVGLFPLACADFDIEEFHRGALAIRERSLGEEKEAVYSAAFLAHFYQMGYVIHDMFLFDSSLEALGMWYRQLLAESIGKKENTEGEEVRVGITPTVSIGSRDLHSVAQLMLGGPRDKTATLVTKENIQEVFTVPMTGFFSSHLEGVPGKTTREIMRALKEGARGAYREAGLPFIEVVFEGETFSEYELGEFLQWKMLEVMLLAHLFNINAFDQEAVEAYKKITRRVLKGEN